jgi:hypothetical protein
LECKLIILKKHYDKRRLAERVLNELGVHLT